MLTRIQWEARERQFMFEWIENNFIQHPELQILFQIKNNAYRNRRKNININHQFVRPGALVLFLPVARKNYHGLFIDLIYQRRKTTKKQSQLIENLKNQSYVIEVCYRWQEAVKCMCRYLDMK